MLLYNSSSIILQLVQTCFLLGRPNILWKRIIKSFSSFPDKAFNFNKVYFHQNYLEYHLLHFD